MGGKSSWDILLDEGCVYCTRKHSAWENKNDVLKSSAAERQDVRTARSRAAYALCMLVSSTQAD